MYKWIIKPILFLFPPEFIHRFVFSFLKLFCAVPGMKNFLHSFYGTRNKKNERNILGINFPNPIGLAAGFDKNAELVNELSCFGFGFIEIGTVTPLPQPGNEKPRMFRLAEDEALINRMGFNNDGAKEIAERLRKNKSKVIIGVNIGKNKITSNEKAVDDYEICFREFFDVADYFVVNVSSPNTPGLRELQEKEPLKNILNRLQKINSEQTPLSLGEGLGVRRKPILLKIAPDLSNTQLDEIIEVILETKLDGVIATNTTLNREQLQTSDLKLQTIGAGGLSGKPLAKRSTEIIKYVSEKVQGRFVIIGSGGIHSSKDAIEKINAGASLVQLYTGFIYEGPSIVKKINQKLSNI
jgi:dihydroorotate dehydrogenase